MQIDRVADQLCTLQAYCTNKTNTYAILYRVNSVFYPFNSTQCYNTLLYRRAIGVNALDMKFIRQPQLKCRVSSAGCQSLSHCTLPEQRLLTQLVTRSYTQFPFCLFSTGHSGPARPVYLLNVTVLRVQGTDDNDDDVHGCGVDDSCTSVLWPPMCTHGKTLYFISVLSFFYFLPRCM